MTVPTNIPETPMGHTEQESLLKSKGKKHLISLELIQHVFKTVMGLFDDKQVNCPQQLQKGYKKGTKRDASDYSIFKNDLYYDTFQISFLAVIKAQGLYDVADPDYDPHDCDQYDKELFKEKQFFVYSVLVTSLQTEKGESWSKDLKEMQDPSFQNCTIIILSQILHNMKLSL